MIKTYYLARFLHKLHISSFKCCVLHPTVRVASGSALTKVQIERYSYVGNNTHITDAQIGGFCSIGSGCGIGGGIHPMRTVSTSPVFLKGRNILGKNFAKIPYNASEKVIIGNDVWIGECAFVKSGITIGDGAIIGAHAVVTHDVLPYTIVAGVPAREIGKRFDEITIAKLLRIKWWEWTDKVLLEKASYFDSPERLLEIVSKEEVL